MRLHQEKAAETAAARVNNHGGINVIDVPPPYYSA